MTVKLLYKQPEGRKSKLTTIAVRNTTETTRELGFASAVAEFGLLRDSEHKVSSSIADVRARANRFKGDDPFGHRAVFIKLIEIAEGTSRVGRR